MRIGIDAHFLEKHYGGLTTFLKGILGTLMDADLCRSERIDSDIKNEYYLFFQYRNPVRLTIDYPITQSPNYQMTQYRFPLWFNFVLPRQLKEHKIDLFFSPNHFLPILKVTKKEVVVIHDLAWKVNPALKNFSYRAYANIFQGRVIQRADKIVVDSENTKRDVMKYYSINELTSSNVNELEKKIEIVYLAADERFKARSISELNNSRVEELKNKYGLPEKFILYVGRIEERKNIKTVLKVIKYLSRLNKLRDLKLVMVGKIGAGGEKYLKEIKENQDILWLNGVSDENLPYIYNLAKIFLFPSFYEGFGLTVLEAMQSGVPVLTSNTSSLPEVVGDGGLMRDPEDYKGFAKDIMRLLEDKKFCQEMRQKGIEQAKKFNWRTTTEKLVKIFDKI